jgi:hypothetical protein
MLLIEAFYGLEGCEVSNESRLFSASLVCFIGETLAICCDRLAYLRCVFLIILNFYMGADSSVTYYISRVSDEPVFAFSAYELDSIISLVGIVLCYNWIICFFSHIIGQIILVAYAFVYYPLALSIFVSN